MSDTGSDPKFATFQPKTIAPKGVEIKTFKPQALTGQEIKGYGEVKARFGSLAATDPESNSHFNLHAASKKSLGVEAEERNHLEGIVVTEVEARVKVLKEAAYQDGFEQGRLEGKKTSEEEFQAEMSPRLEQFNQLLESFDQIKKDLYTANESFLVQLIFQMGRQVLLKELSTDADYIKRLASQLIDKVGAKENIRIKVSAKDQENVEQLREMLKVQYPDLKNVQIEVSDDVVLGGCKIETDLSRLNASVETQFNAIGNALGET